jgi:hypothetical protein
VIEEALWKVLTWKKSSIVFLLCGMFRKNEIITVKSDTERFGIVTDHLQNWIDPIRSLIKRYPLAKWGMVGYTFTELFADLMLAVFSIVSGAYFNAAATMRSVFELMVHAAYVGEKYPWYPVLVYEATNEGIAEEVFDREVKERLRNEIGLSIEEQERITGFKSGMIEDLQFVTAEERKRLHRLYSQLSQLVHPSPLRLRKYTEDPGRGVTFFYDEGFFKECAHLMDETMDLVISVLLTSFPQIGSELKSQKYAYESLARLPISHRLLG